MSGFRAFVLLVMTCSLLGAAVQPVSAESAAAETVQLSPGFSRLLVAEAAAVPSDRPSEAARNRDRWVENDPDAPSPEVLDVDPGPEEFVLTTRQPDPVTVGRDGDGRSSEVRAHPVARVDRVLPDPASEKGDEPLPAPAEVDRVVGFAPSQAVAFTASAGERRTPGAGVDGASLAESIVLIRPADSEAVGVELRSLDAEATAEASSAGLAFGLTFDRDPGLGNAAALERLTGKPELGTDSGWSMELDLGLFDEAVVDATAVGFVLNVGCNPSGLCRDRVILPSSVDLDSYTVTVELPANVIAGFTARSVLQPPGPADALAEEAEAPDQMAEVPEQVEEPVDDSVDDGTNTASEAPAQDPLVEGGEVVEEEPFDPAGDVTTDASTPVEDPAVEEAAIGESVGGVGGMLSARVPVSAYPMLRSLVMQDPEDSMNIAAWLTVSGEAGDFSATLNSSVAEWQVAMPSGHAELSFPMPMPGTAGPVPSMGLFYSSGIADGMNENANAQASRVGLGWSEPVAVVTRDTTNCGSETQPKLCPRFGRHDGYNINFNGVSSPLVRTSGDAGFTHPDYPSSLNVRAWDYVVGEKNDWRVRRVEQSTVPSGHGNGDVWTSWWEVTTGDGTLYVFGRERIFDPTPGSGPAPSWERTDVHDNRLLYSQLSAPLYFGGSGLPSGCTSGYCRTGVAWYLDQVIDPSGNQALYFYANHLNHFEPIGASTALSYDMDVRVTNVHWGLRYDQTPPDHDWWSPYRFKVIYTSRADKPDFYCSSSGSESTCQVVPAFYSIYRMSMVSVVVGGQYKYGWSLGQEQSSNKLWLASIQPVEQVPGAANWTVQSSVPPTTFTKKQLDNRVEAINGSKYPMPRVESMTNESGAKVTFTYGQSHAPGSSGCSTSISEVRPPCDMYAVADGTWWNKHKVTKVELDAQLGIGAGHGDVMVTNYTYPEEPDWAWIETKSGEGQWSDYRGHRQVVVDNNEGESVKHYFYTGMWEDRTSATNSAYLGVTQGSGEPVKVVDPWNQHKENRKAYAGLSLGYISHRDGNVVSKEINHYQNAIDTHDHGLDAPTYEEVNRITFSDSFGEVFNGETNFVVRTRVESDFDTLGRVTKFIDYRKTRADGNTTIEYPDDDRVTYTTYPSALPGASDPWLVANPTEVNTYDGVNSSGELLDEMLYTYDSLGRVKFMDSMRKNNDADYERVEYTYEATGQLDTVIAHGDNSTSSDNQVTSYDYDSTYRTLTSTNGPLPAVTGGDPDLHTIVVDPVFGVPTSQTAPNNLVTTYTYDPRGRLKTVRLPGATMDSYKFSYLVRNDGVDRVDTWVLNDEWESFYDDKFVKTWEFTDGLGRVVQSQARHQGDDDQTSVASIRYDAQGRTQAVTRPRFIDDGQNSAGWYYGEWFNLNGSGPGVAHTVTTYPTTMTTAEGCDGGANVHVSHRDSSGGEWATTETATCGLTTRSWNRDNKLSISTVDVAGNTLSTTDFQGHTTSFRYDMKDRLDRVTDPSGNNTRYEYWAQNAYGPDRVIDPDRGQTTIKYDDFGRTKATIDARGVKLAYSYDNGNRPTEVSNDTGTQTTASEYLYDQSNALGRLWKTINHNLDTNNVSHGQVTTTLGYDTRGRHTSTTYDIPGLPGGPKTITRTVFESGNSMHVYYPSGTSVEYGYNRLGNKTWTGIKDPNNTAEPEKREVLKWISYNALGQPKTIKRGGLRTPGVLNTYLTHNDHDARIEDVYTDNGSGTDPVQILDYNFSPGGKLYSIYEETDQGTDKTCYNQNGNYRVLRARTIDASYSCPQQLNMQTVGPEPYEVNYTYDLLGRITSATGQGTVGGTYDYTTAVPLHAPNSAGGVTYTYDAAGNRISETDGASTVTYTYDATSRLIATAGNVTSSMLYNADGERVRRTVDGTTTWYLGSGLEVDANGTEKISLGEGTYSSGELWAHASDHLGTATYTVSWETSQETYRRYTPFGTPRSTATESAVGASDLTFTGQRDDGELALMYYGARYYDPSVGQFTQPDDATPDASLGADWNRYAYVRNNPIAFTDPTGNEPCIGPGLPGCSARVVSNTRSTYSLSVTRTRQVVRARTVRNQIRTTVQRTQSVQRIVSVNTGAGSPGGSQPSSPAVSAPVVPAPAPSTRPVPVVRPRMSPATPPPAPARPTPSPAAPRLAPALPPVHNATLEAPEELPGYDWGTGAAATINVTYGSFKVIKGTALIIGSPAALRIPFVGPTVMRVSVGVGAFHVATGGAREVRGVGQFIEYSENPRCASVADCQFADNAGRLVRGVAPSFAGSWYDFVGGLP